MGTRLRVVFDTNVAVALVVFADPRLSTLAARWAAGEIEAIVDAGTLAEFDRVLGYPELKLDAARIEAARLRYRDQCIEVAGDAGLPARLPRCSDPDDQMFLALALRAGAHWLLTRDKAVLKLGRARYGLPFRIAQPERFATNVSR